VGRTAARAVGALPGSGAGRRARRHRAGGAVRALAPRPARRPGPGAVRRRSVAGRPGRVGGPHPARPGGRAAAGAGGR
jgi:hypothetical protein